MPKSKPQPKPQIFVSHSANADPDTGKVLDALCTKLRARRFDVLVDREQLQLGDAWRRKLYFWTLHCHGAVVLLSPGALNSDWVAFEAAMLTSRRFLEPNFLVIPVRLFGVTREQLGQGRFSPLAINELQAARGNTPEVLIDSVVDRLCEVKDKLSGGPLQKLERAIVPWLEELSKNVVEQVAEALDVEAKWPANLRTILLVRELLKADLAGVLAAMKVLAKYLDKNTALKLLEALAPGWVNAAAVAEIPRVAQRETAEIGVAVNGSRPFTGDTYVRRACADWPGWRVLLVTNTAGEDQFGRLVREIRETYRRKMPHGNISDQDIDRRLANPNYSEPTVVLLPAVWQENDKWIPMPLEPDVLVRLRQKYPGVTFFMLTGDEVPSGKPNGAQQIVFLEPRLDRPHELEAFDLYDAAREAIFRAQLA